MRKFVNRGLFASLILGVAIIAGCGGGGGAKAGDGAAPAAAKEVTGVAATGAPIVNGTVYLKDSSDTPVERHELTSSDGSFTFDATGLKAPFLLKTSSNHQNLYSIANDFGMTNITPLTSMVVVEAAQRDDLDTFYGAYQPADLIAIAKKMHTAEDTIHNLFANLITTFDVKVSIVNGRFSANHTGYDALLDSITVSIVPGKLTVTNNGNHKIMLSVVAAGQLAGCPVLTTDTTPTPAQTGSQLYTAKCAGCHGATPSSAFIGKVTVSSTQSAIASNLGGMGNLSGLSVPDNKAISDYLATLTPTPVPASDGTALYAAKCAGCHGALASSTKIGITPVRLQNAIAGDVGGMGYLSTLTTADIDALVEVLNVVVDPTPTPVSDGTALYAANCASCHGALASSSKKGITIARLQSAITNDTGHMGYLSTLSVSDVQALVTVLTPTTPTPTPELDGPTLYASFCASCHGALATSAKAGATASAIQAAIDGNTGSMGSVSLKALSAAQVTAIATALKTTPPTPVTDGATLYASYCVSCHGALATSAKAGATASAIQAAINGNTGSMGSVSLKALSATQVAAIAAVLPKPTPTPVTDGATLYASGCAGCHGALATSAKAGATASSIQAAINNNTGSMGSVSLKALSATQVAAIASVLPTPPPTPVTDGATLYASGCAGCHGALASSTKGGATASSIQTAINNNTGSMGSVSLKALSTTQVAAVATVLATVAPKPAVCGSCHAIPPATGQHSKHKSKGIKCEECHGAGNTATAYNAATHNNGVKNIDTANTGWSASKGTCSNKCHGSETW